MVLLCASSCPSTTTSPEWPRGRPMRCVRLGRRAGIEERALRYMRVCAEEACEGSEAGRPVSNCPPREFGGKVTEGCGSEGGGRTVRLAQGGLNGARGASCVCSWVWESTCLYKGIGKESRLCIHRGPAGSWTALASEPLTRGAPPPPDLQEGDARHAEMMPTNPQGAKAGPKGSVGLVTLECARNRAGGPTRQGDPPKRAGPSIPE